VDIANVRVEFESGCVANFTASRVSTERVRKLRFFEPRRYVSIDYARRDVLVIGIEEGGGKSSPADMLAALPANVLEKLPVGVREGIASGKIDLAKVDSKLIAQFAALAGIDASVIAQLMGSGAAGAGSNMGLSFAKPEGTPGEPLRLEIEAFVESVRTRCEPRVTARQGREALALALEIQATMAAHAKRAGLDNFFHPGA
jgi:hypothetical protein